MIEIIWNNICCLRQGIDLLQRLSPADYAEPEPQCFGSTIGGHMRHNIDHYHCFVRACPEGRIDYDARPRDVQVETDPAVAAIQMVALCTDLQSMQSIDPEGNLEITMHDGGTNREPARSTFRRELQFLLSHTIHHYALIAVICGLRGVNVSEGFGIAPSTLNHRELSPCAR